MIQDIAPLRMDNSFRNLQPKDSDRILFFEGQKLRVSHDPEARRLVFPLRQDFPAGAAFQYLFSISGSRFFLALEPSFFPDSSDPLLPRDAGPSGPDSVFSSPAAPVLNPASGQPFGAYTMQELRALPLCSNDGIFAAYTGFHLITWMRTSRFCGACGGRTIPDTAERALVCPACGNRIYPRINPAVIVGVRNGDRLLITRYRSGFAHNALIAGFTEIGETVEETVRREVMEEAGVRVRNLTYYKSQPWGIAADLLMGFYCDVDGDDTIHRDDRELKYAEWVPRKEIVLQPSDYSLTNEMMRRFRDGEDESCRCL